MNPTCKWAGLTVPVVEPSTQDLMATAIGSHGEGVREHYGQAVFVEDAAVDALLLSINVFPGSEHG